ncbi:MAG TPA: bifunctional isocitrate dehydrogenase kinase/phosphatase [Candidatus Udaeobacter sp.]|nr:bifunctional isocitrate dehydrogenase kinase/phosphatase [Candidatus Udaeobacter sp.]
MIATSISTDNFVSFDSSALTDSRLAALCAETAQQAFLNYQTRFDKVTRRARDHFITRDWVSSYADATARLHCYGDVLDELTRRIRGLMGVRLEKRSIWAATKAAYSLLIARSPAWEIAETFFNSLTRRVFGTDGVDQAIEFVDTDFDAPPTTAQLDVRRLYGDGNLPELLFAALTDSSAGGFPENCWNDLRSSVRLAAARIERAFSDNGLSQRAKLEIVASTFYRGCGAYFVGRVFLEGDSPLPIALSLRHENETGITLDAVLHGDVDLAILFSFTRSYFRVEIECPYQLVRYLRELMPRKRLIDLYNAIGFHRHGKTEFYRDFLAHLRASLDRFVVAPGTPGMVMTVFTLPSYDVVFKLIKDRFDFPKECTRADVMRRYRLVFEHDRAGRLVEAHEFEHLRIARERFEPSLLDELLRDAASIVKVDDDDVVIAHAYVERRLRPLNLFFKKSDSDAVAAAGRDYGQSIKDLAASNIFPGDLLTKNFGVTRHGRVVLYDYDELCFVSDCNFRDMPQPTTVEEEMAAEPWFSVREQDIFPEEFLQFLTFPEPARIALLESHASIFRADFWRAIQRRIRNGEIPEVFPYPLERRLIS